MSDFIQRLADGLPLTLIAGLAAVVVAALLFGGARRHFPGRIIIVFWLVLLLGSWGALLLSEPHAKSTAPLLWITLAITAISFFLPMLWKRIHAE